jgi:hypothetical protein
VTPAPVYFSYQTGGHKEYCLSFGDVGGARTILIVPPLFDEMNRTRRMLVGAMRALAARGVRTLLPDLPGCNESLADLVQQSLDDWRRAVADCAKQLGATHVASLRGGGLIDDVDLPRWRLAPVKGPSLLKTMLRTRIAGDKEAGTTTTAEQLLAAAPVELSGYILGADMLASLGTVEPSACEACNVTLTDIGGTPLWLRAEPGDDPAMTAGIADSLNRWSGPCGG